MTPSDCFTRGGAAICSWASAWGCGTDAYWMLPLMGFAQLGVQKATASPPAAGKKGKA